MMTGILVTLLETEHAVLFYEPDSDIDDETDHRVITKVNLYTEIWYGFWTIKLLQARFRENRSTMATLLEDLGDRLATSNVSRSSILAYILVQFVLGGGAPKLMMH